MNFPDYFRQATGSDPYPFQERFATSTSLPGLLRAPTGAGKTATAVLGWLWRYFHSENPTPRRLVYCLPMRVLVEQSEREATTWIRKLGLDVPVHVLMGGVESQLWYLHPEKPAILLGTQDMLLSRALNRGYVASRFHWPNDFGLLNSDCLWVFDEPQLMANGVSTSSQLAGLRKQLGTVGECQSVWMSATLEPKWLDTIDYRDRFPNSQLELGDEDYDPTRPLHKRMTATKTLHQFGAKSASDMKDVAKLVWQTHIADTQTLVIVNTVDRAKAVYEELLKLRKKSESPALLLVHSRFRPCERAKLNDALQAKGEAAKNRILVATQVVEAGVDISSRTLITELCPWASVVQRIGRCNRTGDDGPGQVFWVDVDDKLALPYAVTDLEFARGWLQKLARADVSPKALDEFKHREKIELPFGHKHVLRRRDLLDLFDTTPDLSSNDIDISRFVRSDDPDTDVQVFWREWSGDGPPTNEPKPQRSELCNVPIGQIKKFLQSLREKKLAKSGYVWTHLDEEWRKLDEDAVRPGLEILLPTSAGGYSELGWDPESKSEVVPVPLESSKQPEEGTASDPESTRTLPRPLTIAEHTQNVCEVLREILGAVPLPEFAEQLAISARWHDVGKAHNTFQTAMRNAIGGDCTDQLWAKSGKNGKLSYRPKYFRHELASALAALQCDQPFLVAYLIAAHHGKVRLSIRALPDEDPPGESEMLFALGNRHGDPLPSTDLGTGVTCPALTLDLSPMKLGGDSSWTASALQLLSELGPFRLAYLEAILRAADVRASRMEAGHE